MAPGASRGPLRTFLEHEAGAARYVLMWSLLAVPLGAVVGSAVAFFMTALDAATRLRLDAPLLVWGLPVAGAAIGWMYASFGKDAEAGSNLVVDEIHEPGGGVPLRMAPLVLVGTVVTHLCGGSAGREGTAVQMGGSLAGGVARLVPGLRHTDVPTLLMAGMAAGFGGVFGTPVAGAIFALEVLVVGRMRSGAILPCLMASIVSDQTCLAWGVVHTHYEVRSLVPQAAATHHAVCDGWLLGHAVAGGVLFGLVGALFVGMGHAVHHWFGRMVSSPILRPVLGGCLVIALVQLLGTRDFLGLGVLAPLEA